MSKAIRHVAVIGAAGRLGQWLTRDLVEWGYEVRAVDRVAPASGAGAGGSSGSGGGPGSGSGGGSGSASDTGLPDDAWRGIAGDLLVDVSDREAAEAAVAGADAVVFAAGLCGAAEDPGAALGALMQAYWQVADAAGRAGAQRFVTASSLGVYGLNRGGKPWQPLYFPIDERHPAQPQDLAGLVHWLQEQAAGQLAREHGFASICVRLPELVLPSGPRGYGHLRERQADPAAGLPGLWTYLDVRDAARALRLALETPEQLLAEAMGGQRHGSAAGGHVALNAVASTTMSPQATVELLTSFFPDVPLQEARLPGQAPPVTAERAAKTLGFEPRYGWISHGGR